MTWEYDTIDFITFCAHTIKLISLTFVVLRLRRALGLALVAAAGSPAALAAVELRRPAIPGDAAGVARAVALKPHGAAAVILAGVVTGCPDAVTIRPIWFWRRGIRFRLGSVVWPGRHSSAIRVAGTQPFVSL